MIGVAEQEQVRRDRIAEQRRREPRGFDEIRILAPDGGGDALGELPSREGDVGVAGERAGDGLVPVHDRPRGAVAQPRQAVGCGRDDDVAAEQQMCAAGGDAHGVNVVGCAGDADMAQHGATLLRQPGHVENGAALAFEMRGHAKQRADGHHARAADAGNEDVVGLGERRERRRRKRRDLVAVFRLMVPAQRPAMHGDEARAEAFDAGVILVAARLVDGALAAKLGLDRHHREAVRGARAIAATFADEVVDEDALRRIGKLPALAAAALLGGAGLVVDQHAHTGLVAKIALHLIEPLAMECLDARGKAGIDRVFVGLVADDDDALHALGGQLLRDLRHGELAFDRLAAGHRHGVVVEDLVGHGGAGGDRGADRQGAGMVVGAVAEIGEDVRRIRERRLAEPRHAFAAHLGIGRGVAIHPDRHVVAADPGGGAAAFGHARRGVVRAARAEIGNALERRLGAGELTLLGGEIGEAVGDARRGVEALDALRHDARDLHGIELAAG